MTKEDKILITMIVQGKIPAWQSGRNFYRWFHPDLTEQEAEQFLQMHPEGGFIVPESLTSPGDVSISVGLLIYSSSSDYFDEIEFKLLTQ